MTILVTDAGFAADDWTNGFYSLADLPKLNIKDMPALALDVPNDTDEATLLPFLGQIDLIRLHFPSFADGCAFSQARRLRMIGFPGRLRAAGHVLADQYAMARRSGFDEVEISKSLAQRQPEPYWLARANWQNHDYQSRLRQFANS